MKTFIVNDLAMARYGVATIEVSAETKEEALRKISNGDFFVDDFDDIERRVESADLPDIEDLDEQ